MVSHTLHMLSTTYQPCSGMPAESGDQTREREPARSEGSGTDSSAEVGLGSGRPVAE